MQLIVAIYQSGSNWLTIGLTGWLALVALCFLSIGVLQWCEAGKYQSLRGHFRREALLLGAVGTGCLLLAAIMFPVAFAL